MHDLLQFYMAYKSQSSFGIVHLFLAVELADTVLPDSKILQPKNVRLLQYYSTSLALKLPIDEHRPKPIQFVQHMWSLQ